MAQLRYRLSVRRDTDGGGLGVGVLLPGRIPVCRRGRTAAPGIAAAGYGVLYFPLIGSPGGFSI